jgi:isopenicillin N synthase-like dioxygenase
MDKIPSVDLRDFLSDNPERKQKFVNEIGKAYEEIGFVALKGHFLDDNLVDDLYGEVKNFLNCQWKQNRSMRFRELVDREAM